MCVCVHQSLPLLVMLLHADNGLAVLLGLRRLLGLELLVLGLHLLWQNPKERESEEVSDLELSANAKEWLSW